jgi:hypothetical protein
MATDKPNTLPIMTAIPRKDRGIGKSLSKAK